MKFWLTGIGAMVFFSKNPALYDELAKGQSPKVRTKMLSLIFNIPTLLSFLVEYLRCYSFTSFLDF